MGLSVLEGLFKAFSMILVSEIGDKTFFLAALMAMKHPRRYVMAGSLSALWIMTTLSAFLGWAAPNLLPRAWTHALATLLFVFFGLRSLYDGLTADASNSRTAEELREAEAQLEETEKLKLKQGGGQQNGHEDVAHVVNGPASTVTKRAVDPSTGSASDKPVPSKKKVHRTGSTSFLAPAFVQAFSLIFLGEWGDKSQIATIGLASSESVLGVAIGGCLGHAICNGAAVMGGRHLATRISEKSIALIGGVLFLGFAIHSALH